MFIILAMSAVTAISGAVMDSRVTMLIDQARRGLILQQELERADQVATLLLLFTLVINLVSTAACIAWYVARRPSWLIPVAGLAILLANPTAAFLVRGHEHGLGYAMAAKLLSAAAAMGIAVQIRRGDRRDLSRPS